MKRYYKFNGEEYYGSNYKDNGTGEQGWELEREASPDEGFATFFEYYVLECQHVVDPVTGEKQGVMEWGATRAATEGYDEDLGGETRKGTPLREGASGEEVMKSIPFSE